MQNKKPDGVIFDLDGTLWDARDSIYDALMSLQDEFPKDNPFISHELLTSCMGLPMDAIAKRLFPKASKEVTDHLMERFYTREVECLQKQGGRLYDCVEETLRELNKHHRLFIVSNSQQGYIETFLDYYGLNELVEDHLCWGDTRKPKGENLLSIVRKHHLQFPVYIGDTQTDEIAAREAGMKFIFLTHGFGTTHAPDMILESLCDLSTRLKDLSWD